MNHPLHKGKKEPDTNGIDFFVVLFAMIICIIIGLGMGWVIYDHVEIKLKQEQKK